MTTTGKFSPSRVVNYHSLAIADAYLSLHQLSEGGRLVIHGFSTEPDCHVDVGGTLLKPDMYLDVSRTPNEHLKLWLEVDLGTEGQKQLRGKLAAYWRAYNEATTEQFPAWPRTVWVAGDEERAKELRWLIEDGPKDARQLFAVTTLEKLPLLLAP